MDATKDRQTLRPLNGVRSKLPMPGSRLQAPKPVSKKRVSSPKMETSNKRQRLQPPEPATKAPASKPVPPISRSRFGSVRSTSSLQQPATRAKPAPTRPVSARGQPTKKTPTYGAGAKPAAAKPAAAAPKPAAPVSNQGGGKKRPAWDLKGRLADMEAAMANNKASNVVLQNQIRSNEDRLQLLESQNQHLKGTVAQKEQQTSQATQEISSLRQEIRMKEDELADTKRKLRQQLEDLEYQKSSLERRCQTLEGELSAAQQEITGLKGVVAQLTASRASLEAELSCKKLELESAIGDAKQKAERIMELEAMLAQRNETIESLNAEIRAFETERRRLHNTIQELKGNIRVFCRIRPLLGELADQEIHHIHFIDGKTMELDKLTSTSLDETSSLRNKSNGNKYEFTFDRVFDPMSTQESVFEEISQLVQSALDGYNVCIFAYGQTGSGKTYTMEGPDNPDIQTEGMIPRAVSQIFQSSQSLRDKGWQYTFEASFVEIYNETLRDLLGDGKENLKHEIRLSSQDSNDVIVTNLTLVPVTGPEQVHSLLKKASQNRAVAETKCNERSSRSHSVFRLKLVGHNPLTEENCVGMLNLVDLAGSERLKESGSQGARLKETQAINKSLSNLGNVIMALGNKDSHIPYRNSKLTFLLQNSLGGNSKTLMFVNVSPQEEHFSETLCSLRFATKVNNCNIGTAQKRCK